MAKKLYKYAGTVNRFTWFTTWNYALRCYYSDDIDYVPNPIINSDHNSYVVFYSRKPGIATVDWGDGIIEQYPLVKDRSGNYKIIFRSLNIEWRKNPDSSPWWFFKEDGSQYIPVPPHHYADDRKDIKRVVSINFTSDIYNASIVICHMTEFPIVELPDIESLYIHDTKEIMDIPQEKLARATKLMSIDFYGLGGLLTTLSEGITDKTNINDLRIGGCFDFSDIESSGIRRLSNLTKLTNLEVSKDYLYTYIKEFNDLPNLERLILIPAPMSVDHRPDKWLSLEVDKINPSLTTFTYLGYQQGDNTMNWPDLSGKGLENLTSLNARHSNGIQVDVLPDYLYEMRNMNVFDMKCSTHSQDRTDTFVMTLYDKVLSWDQITMSDTAKDGNRNQFYGLNIYLYTAVYPNENQRPSGIEQAPDGFVKGVSNGNPTTPMEMIYVLKNNYNQRWSIKPL